MKDPGQENDRVRADQDQHHQQDASARVIDRREFVGASVGASVGAAVLGAAAIAGTGKAMAQSDGEASKFSTPDWRTLEPSVKDTDLYTEEVGFEDDSSDLTWWNGRNIAGVSIGLVQFRANLPMMPGNMGNATTFDFPMLYREMNADNALDVMATNPVPQFTDACVEAAKWLELQGVSAIMGNCGFFGHYQKVVQERIDTPFFSSSLTLVSSRRRRRSGSWRDLQLW